MMMMMMMMNKLMNMNIYIAAHRHLLFVSDSAIHIRSLSRETNNSKLCPCLIFHDAMKGYRREQS